MLSTELQTPTCKQSQVIQRHADVTHVYADMYMHIAGHVVKRHVSELHARCIVLGSSLAVGIVRVSVYRPTVLSELPLHIVVIAAKPAAIARVCDKLCSVKKAMRLLATTFSCDFSDS